MQKISARSCSACLHWQPYPQIQGVGVCDDPESLSYDRGVSSTSEPCDRFELRPQAQLLCGECQDWYPLDVGTSVGECRNPKSLNFGEPVFSDQVPSDCFEAKSLDRAEFVWCGTCRQTVHISERQGHPNHRLYANSSQLPVEEMSEFTLAGD